jgi:chemotaxis protein methyltransferase CheR
MNDYLSKSEFDRLSHFIHERSGIKMPPSKKIMMEARLKKRLRDLNINSYKEYCDFLFSKKNSQEEITHMVDVITTNKTDYFREPRQFTFLSEIALPTLYEESQIGIKHPLKVWSAGCSTGEEPYTISIVINEFAKKINKYMFGILATDISTIVLQKAKLGVYEEEKIDVVSPELKRKYFLRSKDKRKKLVRLIPEIRDSVTFQYLNFMDNNFGIEEMFDVIFCRNVIIYFDKPTQDKLIEKLVRYLNPGGYLFMGHSESIFNTDLPLNQLAASIYRKKK